MAGLSPNCLGRSVKVLDTEVPVTFMVELIRSIFRLPVSRIGGDIVQVGPSGGPAVYVTTLRIESEFCSPRTCIFPITSTDIEKGLTEVPFDAMEKIDPYNLAVYYLRVRRTSDAEKLIGDFMREKDISEADRYNVQGGILRQLGKIEEAKGAYGVAKAKDPSDPTPYIRMSNAGVAFVAELPQRHAATPGLPRRRAARRSRRCSPRDSRSRGRRNARRSARDNAARC